MRIRKEALLREWRGEACGGEPTGEEGLTGGQSSTEPCITRAREEPRPSLMRQVAHSLRPLPPPCSLRLTSHRPLPPIIPPLAPPHPSGSARCPSWRRTPPTHTWSPIRTIPTCSGDSPPQPGLPTITVSPRCGLRSRLHTTTTPCPTSPPTA